MFMIKWSKHRISIIIVKTAEKFNNDFHFTLWSSTFRIQTGLPLMESFQFKIQCTHTHNCCYIPTENVHVKNKQRLQLLENLRKVYHHTVYADDEVYTSFTLIYAMSHSKNYSKLFKNAQQNSNVIDHTRRPRLCSAYCKVF